MSVATALVLVGMTSCGGTAGTDSVAADGQGTCAATSTDDAVRTGSADIIPEKPGSLATLVQDGSPSGTVDAALRLADAAAVLSVVSRQDPIVVGGRTLSAAPSGLRPTAAVTDDNFQVLRPARVRVLRLLKGALPACLDVDVPGGSTGDYRTAIADFPESFAAGDTLLGLFVDDAGALKANTLLKAADDGILRLPFEGQPVVDLDVWSPSVGTKPTVGQGEGPVFPQ